MFRNRHLNFGYLLVILVVFAIAISASSKLAYAGPGGPNGALVLSFDVLKADVLGALAVPPDEAADPTPVPIPVAAEQMPSGIKKVIPCIIVTHTGSHCITFIIAGKMYQYCPTP